MKLSRRHSSKSKSSLPRLKSLHITTPTRETVIASDASSIGLGAVLLQTRDNGQGTDHLVMLKGIMRSSKKKCSPLPGHANALKSTSLDSGLPWKQITCHLFHSSLQPSCPKMPPRILRFCLRMMRYNPEVLHVPGKFQISTDALPRAPVNSPNTSDVQFIEKVETFACSRPQHALQAKTELA